MVEGFWVAEAQVAKAASRVYCRGLNNWNRVFGPIIIRELFIIRNPQNSIGNY